MPPRHTPRVKSAGSSPAFATMKARFASPYMVAFTPDAVASSAATPITTKPTCPSVASPASDSTCPWLASIAGRLNVITTIVLITT